MNGIVKVSYLVSVPGANQPRNSLLYSAPANSQEQAIKLAQEFLAANKHLDESATNAFFVAHPVCLF